jgi:hypothetical protein
MIYGTPTIVTNGLVLNLDAANTKSYVSGSTNWFSLGNPSLSGSLVDGPAFSNQNGGSIVFDENLSQYSLTNDILQYTPTQSFTMNVVFYLSSIAGDNTTVRNTTIFGRGATTNSVGIGAQKSQTNTYALAVGSRAINNLRTTYTITLNQIYNVAFIYDGASQLSVTANQYFYLNGVLISTQDITSGLGGTFDTAGYASFINRAVPEGNASYGSGGVFISSIYNRALTQQEVTQNYNALKSRFGLS